MPQSGNSEANGPKQEWPPKGLRYYYADAHSVIIHGDCRDILPTVGSLQHVAFDVVLTDPPYGVSGDQNTKTCVRREYKKNDYSLFVDSIEYVKAVAVPVVNEIVQSGKRCVLTPGNRCITLYPAPDSFGVIYQPASVGLQPWGRADAQPILYYGKSPWGGKLLPGRACSFVQTKHAESNGHPCPKPFNLWMQLLDQCATSADTVLDPFMGSGTTLVVAKLRGIKAIGIEIEERYVEIAIERLRQEILIPA